MYLIVCVDNRMGMLFHHRRQSRDRVLQAYLLNLSQGHTLWMNAYSGKLFENREEIRVSEDFLREAPEGDFCFVEDQPLLPCLDRMEGLILCRWNRDYPGDFFLDLDPKNLQLQDTLEFPGSSHEKITVEVYKK